MEEKKLSKFILFLKNNYNWIVVIILIGALVMQNFYLENKYQKEKLSITKMYEIKFDSLNQDKVKILSEVFSWSVKDGLVRGNLDQIEQLFYTFVKKNGIEKVVLVAPTSNLIVKSTDLKEIGTTFNQSLDTLNATKVMSDSYSVTTFTPIYGLNEKLGTVVISFKK